jgi:hypothetical protein
MPHLVVTIKRKVKTIDLRFTTYKNITNIC